MPSLTIHRRWFGRLLPAILSVLLLLACTQRHYFPVTIEAVTVSPAYRLDVKNLTDQTLIFQPIRDFRPSFAPKPVQHGGRIQFLVQVKRIKVGQTGTNEIVAGPYIDSGRLGPDLASIRYLDSQDIKREIVIDIGSEAWFEPYSVIGAEDDSEPKRITISLTPETMSKTTWFAGGPDAP